jgi:gluconolactonase
MSRLASIAPRPSPGPLAGALLLFALGLGGLSGAPAHAQPSPVPEDASVERIAGGLEFTEGPIWYEGRLLFSDIPADRVYEWTPEDSVSVFLEPSGRANGLAVDTAGRLLLAQHDGQVGRYADGSVESLVAEYEGQRLNSPNDLDVASDGTLYFTDPPYGVDEANRALNFSGVYRLSPNGALTLLTKKFSRPNGIVLSPDASVLYVNDSGETVIWAYDVTEDGTLTNGRQFAAPQAEADGTTDGMAIDEHGALYTTGPGGVWIYAPNGTLLDRISVPEAPTNVAFGGPDRQTLFVTAPPNVYRVRLAVPGAK